MLEVQSLYKRFNLNAGFFVTAERFVYAVNGVDFTIADNEIYGLVGESGCGKTTVARLIVGMYRPDAGQTLFSGGKERIGYIFQDAAKSLNPRMSVLEILLAGYRYSSLWPGKRQAREDAASIMQHVGLQPDDLRRRPADFSGGQRQRIAVARALIVKPELLICDEVVSALDVSIQTQIINLLLELRQTYRLSLLFIAHDLAVVGHICDRIGVMYRGLLVEEATAQDLAQRRFHAYTRYLYAAIPHLEQGAEADRASSTQFLNRSFDPTKRPETWAMLERERGRRPMEEPIEGHFVLSGMP